MNKIGRIPRPDEIEVSVYVEINGMAWIEAVAPEGQRCSVEDPLSLGDTWEEQAAAMRNWLVVLITKHREQKAKQMGVMN